MQINIPSTIFSQSSESVEAPDTPENNRCNIIPIIYNSEDFDENRIEGYFREPTEPNSYTNTLTRNVCCACRKITQTQIHTSIHYYHQTHERHINNTLSNAFLLKNVCDPNLKYLRCFDISPVFLWPLLHCCTTVATLY